MRWRFNSNINQLLSIFFCLIALFTSACTTNVKNQAPSDNVSAASGITQPTESTTVQSTSWFKPELYTGIPSATCKSPVTDVKGLPEAGYKFTVDVGKKVGMIDHGIWAGHIGDGYNAVSESNSLIWEFIRNTRIIQYTRVTDVFSDGFYKPLIPSVKKILEEGKLSSFMPYPLVSFYNSRYVYSEDDNGNPQYNFWFLDATLDLLVSNGIKPIMQMEYMPNDLVEERDKVRWFGGGLINLPKDYNKWRELCYQTAKHCIDRYGVEEVSTWSFSVHEEPDCDAYFIDGPDCGIEGQYYGLGQCPDREVIPPVKSMDGYLKMYDYFADGVKKADARLKVGGPNIAWHDWFRPFLEHCVNGTNFASGGKGAPLDVIFWHSYGPIDFHLKNFAKKESIIQKFPSLSQIPVVLDEWGQVLAETKGGVFYSCEMCPSNFSNYDAAYMCRFIDGILNDPSNNPDRIMRYGTLNKFSGINRYMSVATRDYFIPMPIFNTYIMLAKMGEDRVNLVTDKGGDVVHGFASKTFNGTQILVYRFEELNREGSGNVEDIDIMIKGLPQAWTRMKRYQIDSKTSNAWANYPVDKDLKTKEESAQAQEDSKLKIIEQTDKLAMNNGQVTLRFSLPPNSVSLIVIGDEALPPKIMTTTHIDQVLKEEKAYKMAQAKFVAGDLNGARTDFENLARDSYQASKSPDQPYSIWGQKAHFMLLSIASMQNDYARADTIRANLLKTGVLNDMERFILLNDRIRSMESVGKKGEAELLKKQLEPVRAKLDYLANWSRWKKWGAEEEYINYQR